MFTGACGLAQTLGQLALFRVLLGLGMGGEWASGAALVSETWPTESRGKAFGFMQSSWAIGYAAAAGVTALVLPRLGLAGGLLRRRLAGTADGLGPGACRRAGRMAPFSGRALRRTERSPPSSISSAAAWAPHPGSDVHERVHDVRLVGLQSMDSGVPVAGVSQGGVGLGAYAVSGLVIAMQVGMWLGYVTFGLSATRSGGSGRTWCT